MKCIKFPIYGRKDVDAVCLLITIGRLTAIAFSVLYVSLISSVSTLNILSDIEENPDEVTIHIRKGHSVILPCNETLPTPAPDAATFLPYIIQWKRTDIGSIYVSFGGAPPFMNQQYNGRVSLVDMKSLKIDDVRPDDEGWYECQIVILDGDLRTTENGTLTELIVIGPPRFIQTSDPSVIYDEGDEARIECIARGTPTPKLSWYKNGEPVIPGGHISVTSDSVLFNGVLRDDGSTYMCLAENEEGFVENTVRLIISGAPYIFVPPRDTTVRSGDDAIFKCEAEASPGNITQRWFFNDIAVETSRELEGRWEIFPDGSLMVHDVVPGDEGWFSCIPTNGMGEPPQGNAFLTVHYPAYVVSMPLKIYVTRGLDTVLTCDVDAEPPVDYILWFKGGKQIAIRRLPRYDQEADGSLRITSAELNDSGDYTCEPYNSLSTAGQSTSTTLIVRDPPVFVTKPNSLYQQTKGKDVIIPCSATGDPAPQIEWEKINGDIPQYRATITRSSMTIRDLTKGDHGIYECRATNDVATIVSSTQLFVEFTSPHPPYNVTIVTHITSVYVSWQPAYDGGYPQTYSVRYRIAISSAEDQSWKSMDDIAEDVTSIVIYDLEASTPYEFIVIATNQLGDSMTTLPFMARTRELYDTVKPTDETGRTIFPPFLGLTPSPPRNVSLSRTNQGLVLTWKPPLHFADLVDKYAVEYRVDDVWLVLNDEIDAKKRRLLLDNLQPNTTYQFRVFAFTPAAFSDPSEVITEKIVDIYMYKTKPKGRAFVESPGLIAGIIAGLCLLFLAFILAICLTHRKRKKKHLYLKSNQKCLDGKPGYQGYEMTCVTSQNPQNLTPSPEYATKWGVNPLQPNLSKFNKKLPPNNSKDKCCLPPPYEKSNTIDKSQNGNIINGTSRSPHVNRHLIMPENSASYQLEIDLSNSLAHMSWETEKQFASEEVLREGDWTHTVMEKKERSCSYNTTSTADNDSPLQALDTDSGIGHGEYVYSHSTVFNHVSLTYCKDTQNNENIDGMEFNERQPFKSHQKDDERTSYSPQEDVKHSYAFSKPSVLPKPHESHQVTGKPAKPRRPYNRKGQSYQADGVLDDESIEFYSSKTLPTRPTSLTSPVRRSSGQMSHRSPGRARLYSNPTDSQKSKKTNSMCNDMYSRNYDTVNPKRKQSSGFDERMRETSLLGDSETMVMSPDSPQNNTNSSPVWQRQNATNTPSIRSFRLH